MTTLSWQALDSLPEAVNRPNYTRESVRSSIVHFGVGNFHRAHQAIYCDSLLRRGETDWGIIGVCLRSPAMRDKLLEQEFLYTQLTCDKEPSYRVIGAIQDILVAEEDPLAVIEAVACSTISLVTSTITEKGYCLAKGELDHDHEDFAHDLRSLSRPRTLYGYLASALIQRAAARGKPLTVLCCDNVSGGGERLKQGVTVVLSQHSASSIAWLQQNVTFCSSMVDRVTPATSEETITQVSGCLGCHDAAPVAAEPFTQWIIEDNFAGPKPPFDLAGALFVPEITPYERTKLRFFNAGHSILAALGYLAGDVYVHEALSRPAIASFAEHTLKLEVLPVTPLPRGLKGREVIETAFARFSNARLPYSVLQVGSDSSQKIPQRLLPSIDDALAQGQCTQRLAFALAAWVVYLRTALERDELSDPHRDQFRDCVHANDASIIRTHLEIAGAENLLCFHDDKFIACADAYYRRINNDGVEKALDGSQFVI